MGWEGSNSHPRNRIFLVDGSSSKAGTISAGQQSLTMRGGYAYFMPTGLRLTFLFLKGLRMVAFHFDCELIPGIDCFAGSDRIQEVPCDRVRIRRLAGILERFDRPAQLLLASGELTSLIGEFLPSSWEDLQKQELLQRRYVGVLQSIDQEAAGTRIGILAEAMGLTADQLSKRFRRDLGVSLKTYIDQRITRRAIDLLRNTDLPIASIAEELRFSSEFYASRFLKKQLGMSPSLYRAQSAIERV